MLLIKKPYVSVLLAVLLFISASIPALAAGDKEIKIVIDGIEGTYADAPVLKNSKVFLPVRAVAANLGIKQILWNTAEQSVTIQNGDITIYFRVGSREAHVGEKAVQLSAAPFVSGSGKTYVPADFIGQAFGKQVAWNASAKSMSIATRNKDKAAEVLKSFETGDTGPALKWISADKYIQHNLAFPSGRETIVGAIGQLKGAGVTYDIARVIEDGDYVAVHSLVNFFGSKSAVFDIFRFENGKIVEHWDNLQPFAAPNPSGHTMIDGSTAIADLHKTAANKKLVEQFFKDVFMGQNPAAFPTYFEGDSYTQHNPMIGDGMSGLAKALEEFAKQGVTSSYEKIHMVIGEGNFVLVVGEGTLNGASTAIYDLLRVENGKFAEHWDVIETIPPKDQWKNANGKF
ncbi:stalk domain-containing protein [Paenibacillus prosopidis]|uniref:Putative SnoaL-like aldol condensation-catalyzing enzyme n=1 Tax=Paenibacillus prosopidis TaxID=630520 RepID=A0A368VFZ5_9BACL|nr:stalk domain-containing protein [Paenibacillus prosopidis]RCW40073.1 putative SnoaL-like aldol condensation-catalyzing enzyme [Paenibacillus prosopidis]